MKLATPIHAALAKINSALMQNQEDQLAQCFQGIDIAELLSQDTLLSIRARRMVPLTLLLSSLAVSNEIAQQRAQIWLSCYQSIAKKKLSHDLSLLGEKNILHCAVTSLITSTKLHHKSLANSSGTHQQWLDAFELLIDSRQWTCATALADALILKKIKAIRWLDLAKTLEYRFEIFVNDTGMAQTDVDYEVLAQLFEKCANAVKNAKLEKFAQNLLYRRARCLEVAGDYSSAIKHLSQNTNGKNYIRRKIDIARCHCKQGDITASINELDLAIANTKCQLAKEVDGSTDESGLIAPVREAAKFNVDKASLALRQLAEICTKQDIKIFPVSGTLLGYAREGKLLDHDKDIDIGIIGWQKQFEICMALQTSGLFTIEPKFLTGHKTYCIPIRHNATGVWIDIFIYHEVEDKLVTGVDFFFGYRQTFAFTQFDLTPVRFLGVDMYVPSDIDLNLRENFGNWRIPDSSYLSHLESPSTIDKGSQEHMLTARIHALGFILKEKPVKVRKVIRVLREYANSPWAMRLELLAHMENICDKMEKAQQLFIKPEIEVELAHA